MVGSGGTLDAFNADMTAVTSITNNGTTNFRNSTSAASAAITNNSNYINFYNTSTAGSATITNEVGAFLHFYDTITNGSATITNNGENQLLQRQYGQAAPLSPMNTICFSKHRHGG